MQSKKLKILAKPKYGEINSRNNILYSKMIKKVHSVDEFTIPRLLFFKYDIFHMHWPDHILSNNFKYLKLILFYLLLLFLKFRKTKIVYTVHNPVPKTTTKYRHLKLYYRIMIKFIDGFIFPSKFSKKIWLKSTFNAMKHNQKNTPKKTKIIPLGLQSEILKNGFSKIEICENFIKHKKYLLLIGTISKHKEFHKGVKKILNKNELNNFKIIVAGTVIDKNSLKLLNRLQKSNPNRIMVYPYFLSDAQINWLVKRSHAIVINYKTVNSGVATLAVAQKKMLIIFNNEFRISFNETYGYQKTYSLKEFTSNLKRKKIINYKKKTFINMKKVSNHTLSFYNEVLNHDFKI
jgi:glycosyltransferase involved in cell wall biosynthesis